MQTRSFTLALALALLMPATASADARALIVEVDPSSDVAPEDVRTAIANELGGEVVPGEKAGRLEVRSRGGVLHLTFHDGAGRTIEREVAAPENAADRIRLLALLAGNLARNEADALVPPKEVAHTGGEVTLRAAPGEVVRAEIDARPALATAVAESPTSPTPIARAGWTEALPAPRGRRQRIAGWSIFGASFGLGASGLLFALSARSENDSLEAGCAPSCTESQTRDLHNKVVAADVLLGLGAAGVITGTILVLTAPNASRPVAVTVGDRTIGLVGTF